MEQWAFQLAFTVQRRLYSDQYFHTRDKSLHFELCLNTDMPLWEKTSESSFSSLWGISWGRRNKWTSGSVCSLWGTCWVWSNRSALTSNKHFTSNGSSPIDEIDTWFPLIGKKTSWDFSGSHQPGHVTVSPIHLLLSSKPIQFSFQSTLRTVCN